ncbi:cytochrome (ubi)quinol oxidase subunit III [Jiella sonneratiae]|uniref:Cytochrome (Ubi)quinol oxidase subunit III n=1 Tax=Jiella sonneratiae TaxID=2816856 RepID=A0ABS3IXT7_9HYPH|nr:cytochrome (ubi)quinol oxidase subunit III [Jiella sonneratiae]MBO0902233.1 cytochrome (ubi)quinol oxidase subunit III [Jiella sonneratiae]
MSSIDKKHPGLNLGRSDPGAHQDAEEIVFGFWVFLMSDLVLFALLFATFATMIGRTADGPGPQEFFDLKSVAIESALLLISSFTFGYASLAMKYRPEPMKVVRWLGVTLLLGIGFLGFEVHDFVTMAGKGGTPQTSGFLSAFFALVPTHGLHVFAGCIWIVVMIVQTLAYGLARDVKLRILRLGLFWHFLDIVWIAIISVVYLRALA